MDKEVNDTIEMLETRIIYYLLSDRDMAAKMFALGLDHRLFLGHWTSLLCEAVQNYFERYDEIISQERLRMYLNDDLSDKKITEGDHYSINHTYRDCCDHKFVSDCRDWKAAIEDWVQYVVSLKIRSALKSALDKQNVNPLEQLEEILNALINIQELYHPLLGHEPAMPESTAAAEVSSGMEMDFASMLQSSPQDCPAGEVFGLQAAKKEIESDSGNLDDLMEELDNYL